MKKTKIVASLLIGLAIAITGCSTKTSKNQSEQKQEQTQKEAQITALQSLNPMTLQIIFSEPLLEEEVDPANLDKIKQNFKFDNGLSIVNVPRLKTGAKSTYIVPVTIQKPRTSYTVSYKGEQKQTFQANDEKINIRQTKQITNDTFEIESFREDGVTDYSNIIEAYRPDRGDQAFQLNDENKDENGKQYQIISSLRDRVLTLTSENGEKITANYVLFTQAADGRQAPKFRLPVGQTFTPGTAYTVSSDWAVIKNPTFHAEKIAPLIIQAAEAIDEKSFQLTLDKDPGMDLFAGRSVELQGENGSKVQAQYRNSSRKGAVGIFDVKDTTLESGVKYVVQPINDWATANNVSFVVK